MREMVRAVSLLGLEELVTELGGDLKPLAVQVGLNIADIMRPERLISTRQAHALVNLAAESLKRKDLGLLWGARSDPSRLGPLYVALMNAQTVREAITFLSRYLHINFPSGVVELKPLPGQQGEIVSVRSLLRKPPPMTHFFERRLGSLHVVLGLVCGEAYRPKAIWFTHKQNAAMSAYTRVFGIRPLFEMPENGIVVSRSLLDAKRPAANDQVRDMALAYLRSTPAPAKTSAQAEVAHMLRILMRTSNPTIAETARSLGMHPRTLQRRLRTENISFEAIKDDVRRAIAETLLSEPDTPLMEAAFGTHYANMSAFTRSCRRWFGAPPSQVRRSLLRSRGVRSVANKRA